MKWSRFLKTGLAGLGVAVTLESSPAAADPTGSYVRTLYSAPTPAERCAAAAQRSGQASRSGLAACAAALENPETGEDVRVAVLTNRAILYRRAGEMAQAVADCEAALGSDKAVPGTVISCGGVYVDAGQPEMAIRLLSGAEALPQELRPPHYHNLALAHHDLGEYALAYAALEKALEADPEFAPSVELKAMYRVVEGG